MYLSVSRPAAGGIPTVPSPSGRGMVGVSKSEKTAKCRARLFGRRKPRTLRRSSSAAVAARAWSLAHSCSACCERPADLGQLGAGQHRPAVFLAGLVVPLAELSQQHRDPVDFLIVAGAVGEDGRHAEPAGLLAEVVRCAAEAPEHKVIPNGE